ncbi:MAG: PPOX class F420-dependent oxidoreductase [Oscillochloridaceae bacterium umkhey_bin13]
MDQATILNPAQRSFLMGRHYAVIATLRPDGSIQQTVVWYLLEAEQIRFGMGANSVKARNLRHNPTISLTIEDGPRYLTLSGIATIEPTDPMLRRRLAERYLGTDQVEAWLARRPDAPRASVRMVINRVYGQGV